MCASSNAFIGFKLQSVHLLLGSINHRGPAVVLSGWSMSLRDNGSSRLPSLHGTAWSTSTICDDTNHNRSSVLLHIPHPLPILVEGLRKLWFGKPNHSKESMIGSISEKIEIHPYWKDWSCTWTCLCLHIRYMFLFCALQKDFFCFVFPGIENTDFILPWKSSASRRHTIKEIESLYNTIKGHDEDNWIRTGKKKFKTN